MILYDFESPDQELPFGAVSEPNIIFQVTLKLLQVNSSHLLTYALLYCSAVGRHPIVGSQWGNEI